METPRRAPPSTAGRTHTNHLVIRLTVEERAMLDGVAERLGLNISDTVRVLVRRANADGIPPLALHDPPKKSSTRSKR